MRRLARVATIAAALSLGALATEAQAGPITLGAGSTTNFAVVWSQIVDGTTLSAFGLFTVSVDGSGDFATFMITLTNTTNASAGERVHSIGFDIDPNATGITNPVQGSVFKYFSLATYPVIQLDVCAYSTNGCVVGAQSSNLAGGASDTFGFTLTGNFDYGLTLNNFATTFQGGWILNPDLTRVVGTARTVPEYQSSASFLLVGLGFVVAVGGWRRIA